MTRRAPRARAGLHCARLQRFDTEQNALAFSLRCCRGTTPYQCEHCKGWHLTKLDEATAAARAERIEKERLARVAAYQRSLPERGRGE
jgi:hypothetical protein